jgi:SAM-dependent methyltransferase
VTRLRPPAAVRSYPAATARLHARIRWVTAPLDAVVALVLDGAPDGPPTTVLDWGSGHGLLALALLDRDPQVTVRGADPDADKVAQALAAVPAADRGRADFETIAPHDRPTGTWDVVVLVDVLYLLDPPARQAVLAAAAAAVAPGGRLVVKEMGDRPRWKAALNRVQEHLATRVLRITVGTAHRPPAPDEIDAVLHALGFATRRLDLSRGFHVPHTAIVGSAPTGEPITADPRRVTGRDEDPGDGSPPAG